MNSINSFFPHGTWLMCRPDFFDVAYEINPWMNKSIRPKSEQAWRQWLHLHHTMVRLGAWVEYVTPLSGQPDMVFTANAGLVRGKKVVLSHFRFKERQGEEIGFKNWYLANGFQVFELSDCCFEGEGDGLFAGDTLYLGYGFRTDLAVQESLKQYLEVSDIVPLQLVDPYFYHLDTCFCPLGEKRGFYYPAAFSKESVSELENRQELFAVPLDEARRFACNAVLLGSDIIVPDGCPVTCDYLRGIGINPHQVQLDEFIKSGGAAKCLTNRLF